MSIAKLRFFFLNTTESRRKVKDRTLLYGENVANDLIFTDPTHAAQRVLPPRFPRAANASPFEANQAKAASLRRRTRTRIPIARTGRS